MNDHRLTELLEEIERKDLSTAAHTWRVVLYTRAMCELAGLDPARIARAGRAAALHDLGKLAIEDAILQKPGALTPDERRIIQLHTVAGHEMLLTMGESDELVLDLVRHHHERLDGTGYPDALRGEQLSDAAKYFAVIDTFDALTSYRPYRQDVGPEAAERALGELHAHAGTWYCPHAVELMERLHRSGTVSWVLEYFNDSCPVPQPGAAGFADGPHSKWPRA